jgi:hypothetical protein
MTLDSIQRQLNVAQEVMINIDYAEIDNLLRLHEKIGQDKDLR